MKKLKPCDCKDQFTANKLIRQMELNKENLIELEEYIKALDEMVGIEPSAMEEIKDAIMTANIMLDYPDSQNYLPFTSTPYPVLCDICQRYVDIGKIKVDQQQSIE